MAEPIDASQTRIGHSDESTRCQVKDSKSQSEVFVLFDLVNDFICIEQVFGALSQRLRGIEQLLRYPLQASVDPSELMTFRC